MNELNEPPKPIPSHLPARRALVVQFRPAMPDGSVAFQGRVEHIAPGRAEFFSDERELRKAFTKLVAIAKIGVGGDLDTTNLKKDFVSFIQK